MYDIDELFSNRLLIELDRLSTPLFILDYPEGKAIYMNHAVEHVLGYPLEKYQENAMNFFTSLTHPEDMPKVANQMAYIMQLLAQDSHGRTLIEVFTFKNRLKHASGQWLYIEIDNYVLSYTELRLPKIVISHLREVNKNMHIENYLWSEIENLATSTDQLTEIRIRYDAIKNESFSKPPIEMMPLSLRTNPINSISDREKEVLLLISKGKSTHEIANILHVSHHTIESHRKNIMKKFGVKNVAELIREAGRSFWLGS